MPPGYPSHHSFFLEVPSHLLPHVPHVWRRDLTSVLIPGWAPVGGGGGRGSKAREHIPFLWVQPDFEGGYMASAVQVKVNLQILTQNVASEMLCLPGCKHGSVYPHRQEGNWPQDEAVHKKAKEHWEELCPDVRAARSIARGHPPLPSGFGS